MRIFAAAFVVVIMFWSALSVSAQDSKVKDGKKKSVGTPVKLTEHEKAASDFKFVSLKLGMGLKEVRELFPKMKELEGAAFTNKKAGRIGYMISPAKPASSVFLFFFEDKMYEMRVVYSSPQLIKIGGGGNFAGAKVLLGKLNKKLGGFAKRNVSKDEMEITFYWPFPKAKRDIFFSVIQKAKVEDTYCRIDISDPEVEAKVAAKVKDTADAGF